MTPKILAIDDSHTLRTFIKNTLTEVYPPESVLLACDGKEGVAMARRESPNIILLDYLMPEMRGDEVCAALLAEPATARIPVVLMSSNAEEIQATQSVYENVMRAIAKPFTPDLLCDTVGFVLRGDAEGTAATDTDELPRSAGATTEVEGAPAGVGHHRNGAAAGAEAATPALAGIELPGTRPRSKSARAVEPIPLRGKTTQLPLRGVLALIEDERLTGALNLRLRELSLVTYFTKGRPLLTTTTNVRAYTRNVSATLPASAKRLLDEAKRQQAEDGCPIYYSLAQAGGLTKIAALSLCHQAGRQLFARAWLASRTPFEFARMTPLPAFATFVDPFAGNIDEWAMDSLRTLGDEVQSALAWGEPTGIPTYTRAGYERIQQITLLEDEMQFATLVANNIPLREIALHLRLSVEQAQRILYRFLALDIFAYWPATILRGAKGAAREAMSA